VVLAVTFFYGVLSAMAKNANVLPNAMAYS